jgi:hypothetical protein
MVAQPKPQSEPTFFQKAANLFNFGGVKKPVVKK